MYWYFPKNIVNPVSTIFSGYVLLTTKFLKATTIVARLFVNMAFTYLDLKYNNGSVINLPILVQVL